MKIKKLKQKIIEQLVETNLYTKKQITRFTNEIKDEQDVWGLVRFLQNLGFNNEDSVDFLFKLLIKLPLPSGAPGVPKAEALSPDDWKGFLKLLRTKFHDSIGWYNDKRKTFDRRIKIVGVHDDAKRKRVHQFIKKLGYDVHEHFDQHSFYQKTLVVYFGKK